MTSSLNIFENTRESAITDANHTKPKISTAIAGVENNSGEVRQHAPDTTSTITANVTAPPSVGGPSPEEAAADSGKTYRDKHTDAELEWAGHRFRSAGRRKRGQPRPHPMELPDVSRYAQISNVHQPLVAFREHSE